MYHFHNITTNFFENFNHPKKLNTIDRYVKAIDRDTLNYCCAAIAVDCRPLALGDEYGFKKFFTHINMAIPNYHVVKDVIKGLADDLKKELKVKINSSNYVHCSLDHWSTMSDTYLGIIIYYYSTDFVIETSLLSIDRVKNKKSETTRNVIKKIISEYNL